jgi:D-arabinose 1-dehydrogenase-like Zn-dependent alcohol dehydrogenase
VGVSAGDSREMLRFAAEHNVRPQVELLPMKDIQIALEKVKNNQARYRIVLVN